MIPQDKFGSPVYNHIFSVLQQHATILMKLGYRESRTKNLLFYRPCEEGCFFADMRGTEEVRIWTDPVPLFYANLKGPEWKQRRLWKHELENLHNNKCPVRLSFEFSMSPPFENVSTGYSEEEGTFDWPIGICLNCGKDFQDEGEYCSEKCGEEKRIQSLEKCAICNQPVEWKDELEHHTSYFPEEFVVVHKKCHAQIHKTNKHPDLKPPKGHAKEFYKPKTKRGERITKKGKMVILFCREPRSIDYLKSFFGIPEKMINLLLEKNHIEEIRPGVIKSKPESVQVALKDFTFCSDCGREITKGNKSGFCNTCKQNERQKREKNFRNRLSRGYSY